MASFFGCIDPKELDFDRIAEANWNPDMAIPLVNSSLTASDIITKGDKDGRIEIASDKFCTLVYDGDLYAQRGSQIIQLPGQSSPQQNINVTAAAALAFASAANGDTIPFGGSRSLDFDPNSGGLLLDSVLFKGGQFSFQISSTIQHDAVVTIGIPGAVKGGVAFSKSTTLNAGNGFQSSITENLSSYMFDMTNGGSSTNKIAITISIKIIKGSGPAPTVGDGISFTLNFSSMLWTRIHGDMGTKVISTNIPDTIVFSAFRNSLFTGHIEHADPRIFIEMRNSYGVPIQVDFLDMKGHIPATDPGAGNYVIQGSGLSSLTVNAPTTAQMGQTVTSTRLLDKNNTSGMSVRDVINLNPEFLIYNIQYLTNPGGTPAGRNFILDSSIVSAHARCEMPLFGQATDFEITKEFDFEFKDTDAVEYATLRSHTVNGFPLDVKMQIYFIDANGLAIDSLVSAANGTPIKAGTVDPLTFKVLKSTSATADYTIQSVRWKSIASRAKKMRIRALIESKPLGQDIKIFSDNRLDVRLGVRAKLKVKADF
jgi:hypothetical protein